MEENQNTQSEKIKHLYWRAGFGLSPEQWQERRTWSIERAVDQLFEEAGSAGTLVATYNPDTPSGMMSRSVRNNAIKEEVQLIADVSYDWIMRMGGKQASSDLLEKMTLFWHGHFATRTKKSFFAELKLKSIREHALGNFRDLLIAISKDASMIRYLNNQQNRSGSPNENFARELLELFTIGIGHYTETDVKEAARAFTGWSSNRVGEFQFEKRYHDFGNKTFLGRSGFLQGEDIIDQILTKRETAHFICQKIYRYFVNDEPDEVRVTELANSFYRSNYNIGELMRQIFLSDWFYAPNNRANKIKSPAILLAGMVRQVEFSGIEPSNLAMLQRSLGQELFGPPNVAGWPGGKTWVNNSTLMLRLQLASAIFQASTSNYATIAKLAQSRPWQLKGQEVVLNLRPIQALVENLPRTKYTSELADFLLSSDRQIDQASLASFTDMTSNESMLVSVCVCLMSLPEYQLH